MNLSSASDSSISCITNGVVLDVEQPAIRGHGSKMTFRDIRCSVKEPQSCCCCCRRPKRKEILKGISGDIKPGLNAIMGPTGSGKTSLLDVLANRKNPDQVTGEVLLNGASIPKKFKYLSGYVVQNDIFLPTVTVKEALWFCANIRLPASMSRGCKRRKIQQVISDLGLTSCADTKIGNSTIRGISGGEKKRTSIATEMLLDPTILFLDEPTTGLDAATACSVMRLLKKLGNEGNTIVFSIHQPRYSIFRLFDSLTLLSMGHLVYHGPAANALNHFSKLGYECLAMDNPADFLLDVLIGEHENRDESSERGGERSDPLIELTQKLKSAVTLLQNSITAGEQGQKPNVNSTPDQTYVNSAGHELAMLLHRTFQDTIKRPRGLLANIGMNVVIGVTFGLLYYKVYENPDTAVQNLFGIMFFICTTMLFGSYGVINAFTDEREIFMHEYKAGYHRVISYYLAKVIADLIPLRTVAPVIFCGITYWMVGLKAEPGAFFVFLLTSVLLGYASVGIGLLYSSTFRRDIAQVFLILTFVFTIIFSGLLVNVDEMMPWLSWLKYLSVARYGLVGLSVNELRGEVFRICKNGTNNANSVFTSSIIPSGGDIFNSSCATIKGDVILHQSLSIGMSPGVLNDWDLWSNIVALSCICAILYTLTYVQLRRIKKYS